MRTRKHTENLQEIPFSEAYPLIAKYAGYFFYSGKFYSIRNTHDVDDMIQEICVKWIENGYLTRYSPEVTSKQYFIMSGVKNFFIDTLRKQRNVVSLDSQNEDGFSLADVLADQSHPMEDLEELDALNRLLEELPDETNSRIVVISPLGEGKATLRMLARLLVAGYSQSECCKFFLNPKTMKPVTSGRISQMVEEIRDIYRMCGLA